MVYWLQYYDSFYEMVRQQRFIADVEIVKPEWVRCDVIVDAFFAWYEDKSERKWREDRREKDEADPPTAGKHPLQFRPAH